MNQKQLVSVIIPFFNCENFLAQAIDSVLEQTYSPVEMILINDGSTDKSYKIAVSYPQITIIRQQNRGAAAARNTGVQASNGEFISFLDADDYWIPEKTAVQMTLLEQNPEINAVFSSFENFFEPQAEIPEWLNRDSFLNLTTGKIPSLGTMLIRRGDFDRVGPLNEQLKTGEDLDWLARAKDCGLQFLKNSEKVMHRRLHDSNLSYLARGNQQNLLKIFRESIKRKKNKTGLKENGS